MKRKAEQVLSFEPCKRVKIASNFFLGSSASAKSLPPALGRAGRKRKFQSVETDPDLATLLEQVCERTETPRGAAAVAARDESRDLWARCDHAMAASPLNGRRLQAGTPCCALEPVDPRELIYGAGEGTGNERLVTAADTAVEEGSMEETHDEEFWQYNSFHYWRTPLPPVDLSEIQDTDVERMADVLMPETIDVPEMNMED